MFAHIYTTYPSIPKSLVLSELFNDKEKVIDFYHNGGIDCHQRPNND